MAWTQAARDAAALTRKLHAVGSHVEIIKRGKDRGRTGKVMSIGKTGIHLVKFSTAGDSRSFAGHFLVSK